MTNLVFLAAMGCAPSNRSSKSGALDVPGLEEAKPPGATDGTEHVVPAVNHWPGAVRSAPDCSLATVQGEVDLAEDGDIVQLPSCEATWDDTLEISKSIWLRGAGANETVLINSQGDGDTPNSWQENLLWITSGETGRARLSDIEFNGGRTGDGVVLHGGIGDEVVVDHCVFREIRGDSIHTSGMPSALVYNNTVFDSFKTFDTYAGGSMNDSWSEPLTLGTERTVVYEDNHIEYTEGGWYPTSSAATMSHGQGGRSAWRHNTWLNDHEALDFFPVFDAHGNQQPVDGQAPTSEVPGGDGDHRGTRQVEYYNNHFINNGGSSSSVRLTHLRGGSILMHGNVYEGDGFSTSFYMQEEDGDSRFDYLAGYPGYDQHRVHLWDNEVNGELIESWNVADSDDGTFIVEGTNLFFRPPQEGDVLGQVEPLPYPHPWRYDLDAF